MQRIQFHNNFSRWVIGCWTLLFGVVSFPSLLLGDWRDDIGYTRLMSILGDSSPHGAGVLISIVEAKDGSDNYLPDFSMAEFGSSTDPLQAEVSFTIGSSGLGLGVSNHSSSQSQSFFGNTLSVASAANQVTVYEANNYLDAVLNMTGSNSAVPDDQDFQVQNFSWIGTFATPNDGTPNPTPGELNSDREALRRFDYAIVANNINAFVGLNNGLGAIPHLLSHSYNAIAVGLTDGNHSTGLTHLVNYGVGRSKPELVVPRTTASAATASASSAATLLHSLDTVQGTNASNSETLKAILLAGATKEEFPTWSQIDGNGQWHPLDDTYGAGELNLTNSYLMTLAGQAVGDSAVPTPVAGYGWDYQTIQPGAGNELL